MLDNLKSASIGSARVISEMEKALNFRGIAGGFQNDQFYNVNLWAYYHYKSNLAIGVNEFMNNF